jgi:hypothetical protein
VHVLLTILLQFYPCYYLALSIYSCTYWVPTKSVLNLAIFPCYSNLLLRRRRWTRILLRGVLGYVLPRLRFLWSYKVFHCSIPLRVVIVFIDITYNNNYTLFMTFGYRWTLRGRMCGTIVPGSFIKIRYDTLGTMKAVSHDKSWQMCSWLLLPCCMLSTSHGHYAYGLWTSLAKFILLLLMAINSCWSLRITWQNGPSLYHWRIWHIKDNYAHDQASSFLACQVLEFAESLRIKLLRSSPYYTQANGQAKSSNKTLIKLIKKKIEEHPKRWHEVLSGALWAHHISKHSRTKVTLFWLVYGQEDILPIQVNLDALWVAWQNELAENLYQANKVFVD